MAIIGISGRIGSGKDTIGVILQYLLTPAVGIPHGGKISIEEVIQNYENHEWWLEQRSNWEIKKFAGKLKYIANILTGIPVEKFEDQEFKKTYMSEQWNYWTVSLIDNGKLISQQGRYNTKTEAESQIYFLQQAYGTFRMEYVVGMQNMTVRQFLQELGTDAMRNIIHSNIWVNALFADYKRKLELIKNNKPGYDLKAEEAGEYPNWIITDMRFPNELEAIKNRDGITIRVIRDNKTGVINTNSHPSETALDDAEFDYTIYNNGTISDLVNKVREILVKEKLL